MKKTSNAGRNQPSSPRSYSPLGAFLSYLVPGLGQIYQGRTGKGILFMVCLLGMFFIGMNLGQWKNVFLPDPELLSQATLKSVPLEGVPKALYYRPQFLGQFWIGVAAWPAMIQYRINNNPAQIENGRRIKNPIVKIVVLGWHYLFREVCALLGPFQRAPDDDQRSGEESELNQLVRNSDKTWDLGWVYTVIAGVLNILVIYDAFAGPLFDVKKDEEASASEAKPS